ncbi:MAG TPA: DNA polymerase IV [Candidatus Dormibacteraeota bacterium]|nr:DNA polymerase IV [Candidatus Dormibacteraeota bacterium]
MNPATPVAPVSWGDQRGIIHLDLDAFYASVEQLRRPELRDRPVVVGGAPGPAGSAIRARGVVSAASYEARRWGVRSAMPLATALRLCPTAIVVPVDFTAYREASARVFAIARRYTPLVEPLSLDEAYLDVSGSRRRFGDPVQIATDIRDAILAECGLHASFGVATGKTVAKIASDLRKPRGFVVVVPGDEAAFLAPLPLRAMPGLGPASERALDGLGVSTLGQLAALPLDVVRRRLGDAAGTSIWQRARGVDSSEVTLPGRPKSVSREETFAHDISDRGALAARIRELAADVGHRLRAGGWRGRVVTLKLRYGDFTTLSRQVSLQASTDADRPIAAAAARLLDTAWNSAPVRLLGVGVSGLEDAGQLDLLDPEQERDSRLDRVLDSLQDRFGDHAVRRGAAVPALSDLDFRSDDLRRLAGEGQDSR